MAWVKIPAANHPIYLAALPRDPRISTLRMFGGLCSMVNGNMMAGLFARSAFVNLSEADQAEARGLDGTEPFDPMGNGRAMSGKLMLPETLMDEPGELRDWLRRAFDFTVTLPAKQPKPAAKKPAAKKPAARRPR